MNDMKIVEPCQVLPEGTIMTLKDIVDLINVEEIKEGKVDSKGEPLTRHRNAMKKVKKLTREPSFGTAPIISVVYNDKGQTLKTYALTKKQSIAAAAKINDKHLMQIVDRLEVLEIERVPTPTQPQLPQNYLEALKALTIEVEEKEALVIENKQHVAKIEAQSETIDVVMHNNNSYTVTHIGKDLTPIMNAEQLNKLLVKADIQYKQGGVYQLNAKYAGYGLTTIKDSPPDENGNTWKSMRWTTKGKDWLYLNMDKIKGRIPKNFLEELYTKKKEEAPNVPVKRIKKEHLFTGETNEA